MSDSSSRALDNLKFEEEQRQIDCPIKSDISYRKMVDSLYKLITLILNLSILVCMAVLLHRLGEPASIVQKNLNSHIIKTAGNTDELSKMVEVINQRMTFLEDSVIIVTQEQSNQARFIYSTHPEGYKPTIEGK